MLNLEEYKNDLITKYRNCLEEIKKRTNVIESLLSQKRTTGYRYTDIETIYLQFRKILELIALGNLVSNKSQYANLHKNFENHYHAKAIFKDLEKFNPNFYPIPTKQVLDEKTQKVIRTEPLIDGFLTKDEFYELYDECGGFLHAQNPFKPEKELKGKFIHIAEKIRRLKKLLSHHQIQLFDEGYQIWALMNSNKGGHVQVSLFQRMDTPNQSSENSK